MTGGYFADRYSKRSVTIGTKIFEMAVMAFFIAAWPYAACRWNAPAFS